MESRFFKLNIFPEEKFLLLLLPVKTGVGFVGFVADGDGVALTKPNIFILIMTSIQVYILIKDKNTMRKCENAKML